MHIYSLFLLKDHLYTQTIESSQEESLHIAKGHARIICHGVAPALKIGHPLIVLPIRESKVSVRTCKRCSQHVIQCQKIEP